jgi:hypothetical protein
MDVRRQRYWCRALLEGVTFEDRLGQVVAMAGWWCRLRAAAQELCFVHVGRKVQRAFGY